MVPLTYRVVLLIRHPFIDPQVISNELDFEPDRQWRYGTPRLTPAGAALAGAYANSSWSYGVTVDGERTFFSTVEVLLQRLEEKEDFCAAIVSEGGAIFLNVALTKTVNIGDELHWTVLQRLAALKVNLGIEIF